MICCTGPDANGTGLEQRTFQHYWCLSQLFSVDLVIQPRNQLGLERAAALTPEFGALILPRIDWPYYRIASAGFLATFARELFGLGRADWPVYSTPKAIEALSRLQRFLHTAYEVAFFMRLDTTWSALHFKRALGATAKFVLDLDDLDLRFLAQYARFELRDRGRELVLATKLRAARVANVERRLFDAFDVVTFASDRDAAAARKISHAACIKTLPNCVETTAEPLPLARASGLNLLFVGAMGYAANADAAAYLVKEILPLIQAGAEMPTALTIVGQNPPPNIEALHAPPAIRVTGWVESTVAYYASADICVMPIRIGSGTRFKALEALNFGRPIVSTSLGVEGLGLVPEVHYLRGDNAEEFAGACLRLARDPGLRDRLIANGRERVEQEFGREAALGRWREALAQAGLVLG